MNSTNIRDKNSDYGARGTYFVPSDRKCSLMHFGHREMKIIAQIRTLLKIIRTNRVGQ